jgi:hypothetical protein
VWTVYNSLDQALYGNFTDIGTNVSSINISVNYWGNELNNSIDSAITVINNYTNSTGDNIIGSIDNSTAYILDEINDTCTEECEREGSYGSGGIQTIYLDDEPQNGIVENFGDVIELHYSDYFETVPNGGYYKTIVTIRNLRDSSVDVRLTALEPMNSVYPEQVIFVPANGETAVELYLPTTETGPMEYQFKAEADYLGETSTGLFSVRGNITELAAISGFFGWCSKNPIWCLFIILIIVCAFIIWRNNRESKRRRRN